MSPRPFVHLHNHTEYSLLDGANRIDALVAKAVEYESPALAITDHGVMFGAMEFYFECKKQGIKPIVGMEAYVAPNGLHYKSGREENQTYHLLLLAKNETGYRNLCKLHSIAALQGFYYKPRIDHELLSRHAEGLIGTSACLGSEICQALLRGEEEHARDLSAMYKEIFDPGCFYIELQDHQLFDQDRIREPLTKIAKDLSLPLVATNDAHYLCKGDAQSHDVLLCVGTGALVSEEKRLKFPGDDFYLKSPEEMCELFADVPDAIENTLRIAEECNFDLGKSRSLMPTPTLPEGKTASDHLRDLCFDGLEARGRTGSEDAYARLGYELSVIEKTGFESYFLLVSEFTEFSRKQGIAFGARGSAAGSLVSYCLGITDVDPLEYDLTFERFLNPERISMPDIDLDFEDERRDEVIKWVNERFGEDHVAQIVTFGTLGSKAAIRDAGRVMGYSPMETDRICKTIPQAPGMTLKNAMEQSAEFRLMVQSDNRVRELVEVAKGIEGLSRHAGVHAAGIVVSSDPLMEHIPLYRGNDNQAVTAYEMGILEKLGLLKIDVLGLSNLTVVSKTVERLKAQEAYREFSLDQIPLDDKKSYDMLGRGETVGVFQLESAGMRRNIIELKPTSVRELAAMVALFRPGPMGHIPRFVSNKFGRTKPEYLDERMVPILEETYGVIVYQDQVLKLVQALAGFSLGKADVLRRAMGKKDKAAMDAMHTEFLSGAAELGVARSVADEVWVLLLPFAGYAFNKAHAVCYAILAYQTAYLKANFPVEYMASLLSVYRSKEDRVAAFIEECRRQNIDVLPPDVNGSQMDFEVEMRGETPGIRFGLAAIKGIGDGLVRGLIAERAKQGRFVHLYEFAERTRAAGMNRAALEALIKAGALDSIDPHRKKLLDFVDAANAFADQATQNRLAGQESLFGGTPERSLELHYPVLPDRGQESRAERLAMEKEVMGVYVSDHPLRGFEQSLQKAATHSCASVAELDDGTPVRLAGIVCQLRTIVTKTKGEKMATLVLEDLSGQSMCTAFPTTYERYRETLAKDNIVRLRGVVMHRDRTARGGEKSIEVRVEEAEEMCADLGYAQLPDLSTKGSVTLTVLAAQKKELEELRNVIASNPGSYRVIVRLGAEDANGTELLHRVNPSEQFLNACRKTLQRCTIQIQQNDFSGPDNTEQESALSA